MPKCTVCTHPQYQAIDQALLSGDFTLAALSQKFGPSSSALQRHKDHLRDKMRESRRRLQEIQEQGSLLLLNGFLDHVKKGVETAEAEGNLTGVFRGSYIGSRIIHQLGRLEASISLDTLHRLLTSPAWVPQGSLLPTDPKLITELHQALVENMSVFCPEPPPEISEDDSDEDEDWNELEDDEDAADPLLDDSRLASAFSETENGKRNTENGFLIRQLQELFPDLDLTLDDLPPRTEKLPKNQRKISEKSAPETTRCALKSLQNYEPTPSEKKTRKIPKLNQKLPRLPPFRQPTPLRPLRGFHMILTSHRQKPLTPNCKISFTCRRPKTRSLSHLRPSKPMSRQPQRELPLGPLSIGRPALNPVPWPLTTVFLSPRHSSFTKKFAPCARAAPD